MLGKDAVFGIGYLLVDNTFSGSKNRVGRLGMVTRTFKWIGSLEWDVARGGRGGVVESRKWSVRNRGSKSWKAWRKSRKERLKRRGARVWGAVETGLVFCPLFTGTETLVVICRPTQPVRASAFDLLIPSHSQLMNICLYYHKSHKQPTIRAFLLYYRFRGFTYLGKLELHH